MAEERRRKFPLSVLDLSPVRAGATARDALLETLELARACEALGYARFWVAEHHNAGALACPAPELLVGQIAATTRRLRVGAGGVMLPNHAPLRVAEAFRVLTSLFPGRIDLGLGRAAGTDARAARALGRGRGAVDTFPAQLDELFGYLDDDRPARDAFAGDVRAIPFGAPAPEVWLLGSSVEGARLAGARGVAFAFAHHLAPDAAVAALAAYRAEFRPGRAPAPRTALAVSAMCAEGAEAARDLEAIARVAMLRFAEGRRDAPLPSLEEARAFVWDDTARGLAAAFAGRAFVGTRAEVAPAIAALADDAGADELVILGITHDPAARLRSYALLAEAIGA